LHLHNGQVPLLLAAKPNKPVSAWRFRSSFVFTLADFTDEYLHGINDIYNDSMWHNPLGQTAEAQ
jgi:hypothetical protein